MNLRQVAIGIVALATPASLAAQYRAPRSADYLFGADVWGARALWVHPAGLGIVREASIMAEAMLERNAADDFALAQFTFGFNSRGIGFGYRRDRFGDAGSGGVWRLGFGRAAGTLAFGAAASLYPGDPREESLDLGIRFRVAAPLEIALATENIGQPTVRDSALRFTAVGGAAWAPLGDLARFNLEARATDVVTGSWHMAYRAGLRVGASGRIPFAAYGVLDLDDDLSVVRLVAGLSVGGYYQGVLMGSGAKRAGTTEIETISLTGLASHRFP
ncbi:MAG TPA: hypothetical protein VFH97_09135 [Gemmatimonadales bacterium]|nr:hypothetical protein [Gemmatimonadales bacterium]